MKIGREFSPLILELESNEEIEILVDMINTYLGKINKIDKDYSRIEIWLEVIREKQNA